VLSVGEPIEIHIVPQTGYLLSIKNNLLPELAAKPTPKENKK
jgi:hypothetical protein